MKGKPQTATNLITITLKLIELNNVQLTENSPYFAKLIEFNRKIFLQYSNAEHQEYLRKLCRLINNKSQNQNLFKQLVEQFNSYQNSLHPKPAANAVITSIARKY